MKLTPSPLWCSLLMACCLASCGSDFSANGVSTGGTGGQVPDLGDDDSLPDDSALIAPNPAVAANQANQLSLSALDIQWQATNWRLIQTAQGVQVLPDFFEKIPTDLGDKPEGMLANEQYVVLFGSNDKQSFFQVLSVNNDGQPTLSSSQALNGRIVQATLNDSHTLDLLIEDYTGQTNSVGSYHIRANIQAGVVTEPMTVTRLASRPLASATGQSLIAWIAANKGGTQWLYVMDCPATTVETCRMPPRPTKLGGKLPSSALLLRREHPALFVRDGRVFVELVDKFGKPFMAIYKLQNGLLTSQAIPLSGTATPLITTSALATPNRRLSKFVFGGGGGLPPAVNPSTQSTLVPTSTTWLNLRVEQGDEQAVFYPNQFGATAQHRVPMRGKAEGVYANNQLLIALSSTSQDTITTLIAPNGSLDALTISTTRAAGRVDQLRIQQNSTRAYIDELINQASGSSEPAYFSRALIDAATQTKSAPIRRVLPYSVLASAASAQWMVWLGRDESNQTWIHPIFCQPTTQDCEHPNPVKLQGQLISATTGLRSSHPDVKIIQDRLFVYSVEEGQRYLNVYAFADNQLVLTRRELL